MIGFDVKRVLKKSGWAIIGLLSLAWPALADTYFIDNPSLICQAHFKTSFSEFVTQDGEDFILDFDEEQYKHIQADYLTFFEAIKDQKTQVDFVPMSALEGDMIVERGNRLSWYNGPTLLEYLENLCQKHNNLHHQRIALAFLIQQCHKNH